MIKLAPLHVLPRVRIVNREGFILEECLGKRVLHLGCVDWPFTETLFDTGQLLHQDLEKVSAMLAGLDSSHEGINLLQSRGVKNLFVADAADSSTFTKIYYNLGWTPEIILAGEILEHVDAPGPLLRSWAQHMPPECRLLITVPNALNIKGFLHVMLGHEKVHSDHVAYYSYFNMIQLLSRCGLEIVDTCCYSSRSGNPIERVLIDPLVKPLLMLRPFLCEGLIFCTRRLPLRQ